MKFTEMTIGYARTINLGNYESAQIKAAVTFELDPEDDGAEALRDAQAQLRSLLEETWKSQHRPNKGDQ